ncbi:matrix-remodeling-associated protein 5 [Synchiropus splendidus]|uniref:matrix-remodeling-associated protein 5 n=1 Tax=Synchiropus splendidus TaxID=270530 RepID=UPI00237E1760|nr:matrix-remodeling-associated protein 5 [Synchiropus splendidus]
MSRPTMSVHHTLLVLLSLSSVFGVPCPRPCTCPHATELHCTFRSLVSVPAAVSRHIERMNLGYNRIHKITDESLAGLRKLEQLMVHGNDVHSLPDGVFRDLVSLQVLRMSYNKVKEINRHTLQGLWSVARLHLDHNQLEFIHPDAFHGLTSLRMLQLEGNRLQQVHPTTFTTFTLMGLLHVSTLKYLDLSSNGLTTLSTRVLATMPQLENLYLHGNPWTCDCNLVWIHDWDRTAPGVLKCKKDKAFPGGQLCAKCSSPKNLRRTDLQTAENMLCSRPIITSPNGTPPTEDSESEVMTIEDFTEPFGNISLGISDEHGNEVALECTFNKPKELNKVTWEQLDQHHMLSNISVSVDLECPVDRVKYEQLWRLIAYYSSVPAHLQRGPLLSEEPHPTYVYRQDPEKDAVYYTGVKANIMASAAWLMQTSLDVQLNRHQSSSRTVKLILVTRVSEEVEVEMARTQRRTWVMIESTNTTRHAYTAILGNTVEMPCKVRSSGKPVIYWMLPDGAKIEAPHNSADNRLSVTTDGQLAIKSVSHKDAGIYYCFAKSRDDVAVQPFQLTVQDSSSPPPGEEASLTSTQRLAGNSLLLPCSASGSPDAEIHWILPNSNIVSFQANSTKASVYANGTLYVSQVHLSDSGYYKCIALNQHGSDALATKVTVLRHKGLIGPLRRFPARPQSASGVNTKIKVPAGNIIEEGSGGNTAAELPPKRRLDLLRRRVPNVTSSLRRGVHQSGPMWKRPAVLRKPVRQPTPDNKNVLENRRQVNMSKSKIDPEKWADILAKIRVKNAQNLVTVIPVPHSTSKLTPQPHDIEGSSDVQDYATTGPTSVSNTYGQRTQETLSFTEHYSEHSQAPAVTPHTAYDAQHTPNSTSLEQLIPPSTVLPQTTSAPLHAVTVWQSSTNSTSSSDTLSQSANTDVDKVKTADWSQAAEASQHSYVLNIASSVTNAPSPSEISPSLNPAEFGTAQVENGTYFSETPSSQWGTTPHSLSAFTAPSPTLAHVHAESKELSSTLRRQSSPRKKNGGRRKRPNRRKHKFNKAIHMAVTTPGSTHLPTTRITASTLPEIDPFPVTVRSFHTTVPFTYGQAALDGVSHTESKVLKQDDSMAPQLTDTATPDPNTNTSLLPEVAAPLENFTVTPPSSEDNVIPTLASEHLFMSNPTATVPQSSLASTSVFQSHVATATSQKIDSRAMLFSTAAPSSVSSEEFMRTGLLNTRSEHGSNVTDGVPAETEHHELTGTNPSTSLEVTTNSTNPSPDLSTVTTATETAQTEVAHSPLETSDSQRVQAATTSSPGPDTSSPKQRAPVDNGSPLTNPASEQTSTQITTEATFTTPQDFQTSAQKTTGKPLLYDHRSILRGKPKIIQNHVKTVTVKAEGDAQLSCEAVGDPKPFLSWTKVSSGATIVQDTKVHRFEVQMNGSLTIRNSQPADGGDYQCVVQNQYGIDKTVVSLVVQAQHPHILHPRHRDVSVQLGGSVDVICQAEGHPAPRVTWVLPNFAPLAPSPFSVLSQQRVAVLSDGTLRLRQASFTDEGIYKCIGTSAAGADAVTVHLHVSALPPVIHQKAMENRTLAEGSAAYIHCTATSAPQPAIRWITPNGMQLTTSQFVSGRDLVVFPNGTLHIRKLMPENAGRYECVASNPLASSRRIVTLHVAQNPSSAKAIIISSSPLRTNVIYGGRLLLNCVASGKPLPRIMWKTPSNKLVDAQYSYDPRINVFHNGTLSIHSVTNKDSGDYVCVARNKMGDDYILLKANILTQPAKIEQKKLPPSQEVVYGGDLKVDCVASGLPNPEISWSLPDGTMVNPAKQDSRRSRRYVVFDNGTLFFNHVGMREEGDYTCYAENQVGKDEMKVRVKVKAVAAQPQIQDNVREVVRVHYGETVSLRCKVKGEPTPIITWISPTHRVIFPTTEKYQMLNDGTLVVQKVQRSDGGNYTCRARNSAGQDHKVTQMEVLLTPPTIVGLKDAESLRKVVTVHGQRALIDCVAKGTPHPRVMWVLPGNIILPAPYYSSKIIVHQNGTLDIRSSRKTDSGKLTCIARNEGGEVRLVVHLDVKELFERSQVKAIKADNLFLTVGMAMTLNCSFDGPRPPYVTWILPNGTPLQSGMRSSKFFHHPNGSLLISNPSLVEAGMYRCFGRQSAGLVERVVALSPGKKPEILNRYNSPINIMVGENLTLHCLTNSDPMKITWTMPSGVVLNRPQRVGRYAVLANGSLAIQHISVYDRGSYVCRAANEYGSDLLKAGVTVIAYPPRITSGSPSVIYARRGVAVQLNCVVHGIPRAEVTWETPDKTRMTVGAQPRLFGNKYINPQGSLIVQNPTQKDAGVYRCTARNAIGLDSKSTLLNVF